MANIMKLIVSNYNDIMKIRDPTVDSWLFMSSPLPVVVVLAVWLTFVLKAGPSAMKDRPAFELKNTLIWYNGFQVIFSIWLAVLALDTNFYKYIFISTCSTEDVVPKDAALQHKLAKVAWWYFIAKLVELLDTVFFVLRKKQNQVTFLHVYHHTIMAFFTWTYLKFLPGEQGLLIGFLNSTVHIIMYTYYMIAAMGPKYKKYLWWKKYMTSLQLFQFLVIFFYLMLTLAIDCTMPRFLTYFFVINVIIFLYLFGDFYRKAYVAKKNA